MVRVEMAQWGQTPDDLRRASVHATHRRSRERFQALYLIASGRFNATTCAAHIGRQDETVLGWVHRYNAQGPDGLTDRRTGGRAPLLTSAKRSRLLRSSRRAAPPRTACPVTAGP
jgi:transposase